MGAGRQARGIIPGRWIPIAGLVLATALVGCAGGKRAGGVAAYAGDKAEAATAEGSYLAYEHDVGIVLAAAEIPARLQAAQADCRRKAYGACEVLQVSQQGGDYPSASLTVRIVPAGVEPMIAAASKGGEVGSRSTHAEDLAQVVRDNTVLRDRLQKERERLQEFQQRRDLSVADMIALSQQLSQVEAQLQAAEQEAAQHRRRIDTQKLTLNFQPPEGQSGRSEIRQALRDFFATLAMGAAWTIRAVAFLIPLLLVLAVSWAGWRRWRRRKA